MNRRPFSKLRDAMPPVRQAANRKAVEQELSNILLAELRPQSGLTQRELTFSEHSAPAAMPPKPFQ
jgi:hypothetical protein